VVHAGQGRAKVRPTAKGVRRCRTSCGRASHRYRC
jgi:hypothetical protein